MKSRVLILLLLCGAASAQIINPGGSGASAAYPLTVTGTSSTSTNSVITATDTASNTGTGYAFNATTATSSALNGLKINRGSSGSGSRAWSVQDNAVEKAYVDFSGNASFNSVTFGSLVDVIAVNSATGTIAESVDCLSGTSVDCFRVRYNGTTFFRLNTSGQIDITNADIITSGNSVIFRSSGGTASLNSGIGDVQLGAARRVAITGAAIGAVTSCGTSPSVTGNDNAFKVTVGTGGSATSCTIAFSAAWSAAPTCTANSQTDKVGLSVVPATSNVVISATAAFTASSKINVLCF